MKIVIIKIITEKK